MAQTTTSNRTVAALARSRRAMRAAEGADFVSSDREIQTTFPLSGGGDLSNDLTISLNLQTVSATGEAIVALTAGGWLCNFLAIDAVGAVNVSDSVVGVVYGPRLLTAERLIGTALRII